MKLNGFTTMPSPPRSVSLVHQSIPSASLAESVTSTILYGVLSNNSGSLRQILASSSMCHMWSWSTWTRPSVARRWNGASFRSVTDDTDQQYCRYAETNLAMFSSRRR